MTDLRDTWTLDETTARIAALDGVRILVASVELGAPESAWGDMFVYDGDGPTDGRHPFATVVVSDYPGFDTASDLDRPGAYRVNIHVGRERFRELLGYGPESHADSGAHDHREPDRLLPHPVYAAQSWVSVVNPGTRTGVLVESLLAEALTRSRHG